MDLAGRWTSTSYDFGNRPVTPVRGLVTAPVREGDVQIKLRAYRRHVSRRTAVQLVHSAYTVEPTLPPLPLRSPTPTSSAVLRRRAQEYISPKLVAVGPAAAESRSQEGEEHPPEQPPEPTVVPSPRFGSDELSTGAVCTAPECPGSAIQRWTEAAWKRFGTVAATGSESVVRSCAKWLALSCNTRRGVFERREDIEHACCSLGMEPLEAAAVASELWDSVSSSGNGLPVATLLTCVGKSASESSGKDAL
jgi:hypothetical protein